MLRPLSPDRFAFSLLLLVTLAARGAAGAEPLQFNRDIRPILSENCFHCHGQDPKTRDGGRRLDVAEGALAEIDGVRAVVPGKPDESEMMLRLESHDKEEQMPPPKANRRVSPEQIALVRRWIAEGGKYQRHWAYEPPHQAEVPAVPGLPAAAHPIDAFVRARLAKEGLAPAPAASPETWLRRAALDLTGLPPTPPELDRFTAEAAARGEEAYADAADRLLASPHYGERLASEWLDVARYADSHGFNNDGQRSMWRWRDWVIDAFNANLPYDRFLTEQLAGDLLPQPTLEQRIATGFSRNHGINSEGGIIDEEYRVEYVADRVRTTSMAWLGLTFECARCHDHKFDTITQRDYYRLSAFFNNVPEHGEDGRSFNAVPMLPAPTRAQQAELARQGEGLAALAEKLHALPGWMAEERPRLQALATAAQEAAKACGGEPLLEESGPARAPGTRSWRAEAAAPAPKIPAAKLDWGGPAGFSLALWLRPEPGNAADVPLLSGLDYSGSPAAASYGHGRELRLIDGEIELRISDRFPVYAMVLRTEGAHLAPGEWRHVTVSYSGGYLSAGVRLFIDGVESAVQVRYDGLFKPPEKKPALAGADNAPAGARYQGELAGARSFPRGLSAAEARSLFAAGALPLALSQPAPGEHARRWLETALRADLAPALAAEQADLWEKHLALRRTLPTSMVMQELPEPRPAFVLVRGRYDAHGDQVEAGVPEQFQVPWPEGAPRNRLGLARWLTQPEHPLTARVVVNRFWAQLFGIGLVKTLEDFGSQGEYPSHPEVLDWLACDFVAHGWDVKRLLKTLVLSATYRQASAITPALLARDPENRLLARGPRVRLPAEVIRDQALAISGLLTAKIGGPSVYPYQPEKLYDGVVVGTEYPGSRWKQSTGEDLYRRSLYTFWKRTVTHPAMLTFDAPDRETCIARRSRTNTPLQALTLWNEPGYLESARLLGTRLLHEGGAEPAAQVAFAFRLATGRHPTEAETRVLVTAFARLRADFQARGEEAAALVQVGASPVDATLSPADLAAATAVASMLLNLDETITKN